MPVDLETLLAKAREKTEAEAHAAKLRSDLSELDAQLQHLRTDRQALARRLEKATGVVGRLRRDRVDANNGAIELARIDSAIAAVELRQRNDQELFRSSQKQAHGVELARAQLGAEMERRARSLPANDPARLRLSQIDRDREELVQQRGAATAVSELAAELLLWVDAAEQADDGTDYMYVHLRTASMKTEQFQQLLSSDALTRRALLKDRIEGFRALGASESDYSSITDLLALAADSHVVDHQVWLHRVRVALDDALEAGVAKKSALRDTLVAVDHERVALLTKAP